MGLAAALLGVALGVTGLLADFAGLAGGRAFAFVFAALAFFGADLGTGFWATFARAAEAFTGVPRVVPDFPRSVRSAPAMGF